jgi:hypothetical protein
MVPMMSPRTTKLSGQATVKLTNGTTIVGHARYDGRVVHVNGRVRHASLTGVRYGPLRRRTVPLHLLREVLWDAEYPAAAPKAKPGYSRLQGRLC